MSKSHASLISCALVMIAALALGACPVNNLCGSGFCPNEYACRVVDQQPICISPEGVAACGNGFLEPEFSEECDDSGIQNSDGCSADCQLEVDCDEFPRPPSEQCDNMVASCGNGIRELDEQCDCGGLGEIFVEPEPACAGGRNSDLGGYCNTNCRRHCGNGSIAFTEVCDTAAPITNTTCVDLRYDFGEPSCSDVCDAIRSTSCRDFNWRLDFGPLPRDFFHVGGNSESKMFAVGNNGALLHYNGERWIYAADALPPLEGISLHAVWGNENGITTFAVGDGGTILSYNHAIEIWEPLPPISSESLRGIWGTQFGRVFVVGDRGTILHANVFGWEAAPSPTSVTLRSVWGKTDNNVFAVGDSGTILYYDGQSWQSMPSPTSEHLHAVSGFAQGNGNVLAVGDHGTVLYYDGQTWQSVPSPTTEHLRSIWVQSPGNIWIVGDRGTILHIGPRGVVQPISSPTSEQLNAVWGTSNDNVFITGNRGTLLHFDGVLWERLPSATTHELHAVWHDPEYSGRAYAVGADGTIVSYDEYRDPAWQAMDSPTFEALRAVWGITPDNVFAAGDGGTILYYDGQAWQRMPVPDSVSDYQLSGIWGSAPDSVFAVGEAGTILYYDGQAWQPMGVPTEVSRYHLSGIWGSAPDNVFAVGEAGTVLHYDGQAWEIYPSYYSVWFRSVSGSYSLFDDTVFIVGDGGIIVRVSEQRIVWESMPSPTRATLHAVWHNSFGNAFAAGDGGTILSYNGQTWMPFRTGETGVFRGVAADSFANTMLAVGEDGVTYRLTRP